MAGDEIIRSMVVAMYTDLVGSTPQRRVEGDDRARQLMQTHDQLVTEALERHHGRWANDTGDGALMLFDSANDALRAAVYLQQLFANYNRERNTAPALDVRIGAAAGEVAFQNGKYDGLVNYEASRVTGTAGAGEIHCTTTVALLAGHNELTIVELGDDLVRDFPDTGLCRVEWSELPRSAIPVSPLIDAVRTPSFVGRTRQLDGIVAALEASEHGELQLVLIQGEAGVGKTCLAAEAAAIAKVRGAQVWFGRCAREDPPPYQVWEEVLGPEDSVDLFGSQSREDEDESGGRYRIYADVERLLAERTATRSGLILLDDLTWADRPSLLLLQYLTRHGSGLRCLVLATCRTADIDRIASFVELIPDIKRGHRTIALDGLSEQEIAEYLLATDIGSAPAPSVETLAAALHRRTSGNALLVTETVQAALQSDLDPRDLDSSPVAPAIREIVDERLGRVDIDTRHVLQIASVIGREFTIDLVDRVAGLGPWGASRALDDGVAVGLIRRDPNRRPGRYGFVHDLFREAMLEDTGALTASTHQSVAEAIHQAPGWKAEASKLVHHLSAAGSVDSRLSAISVAQEAAMDTTGAKALALLEQARTAARTDDGSSILAPYERLQLELAYGVAQKRAGSSRAARTLQAVAQDALDRDFSDLVINAALAGGRGVFARSGEVDEGRIKVLNAALARTEEADRLTRARLLGQLGAEYTWLDQPAAAKLTDEAMAIADGAGDRDTRIRTLLATFGTHWNPTDLEIRATVLDDLRGLIDEEGGSKRWRFATHSFSIPTCLELGDTAGANDHLEQVEALAAEIQAPETTAYSKLWRSTWSTLRGDIDDGETLADEFSELFDRIGRPTEAFAWRLGLLYPVHWHRGTLTELDESFAMAVEAAPGLVVLRAALAAIRAQTGDPTGASAILDDLWDERFVPDVAMLDHLVMLSVLADAEAHLRSRERARWLVDQLTPFRGQYILDATSYFGAVERPLAIAHAVAGELDQAVELFAEAARRNDEQGAEAMAARTRVDWARELCRSSDAASRTRGRALAERARVDAGHRWPGIEEDAEELISRSTEF